MQVVLDRARTNEHLPRDFLIGGALSSKRGDLSLLCGQVTASVDRTLANPFSRGKQFCRRAAGEPRHTEL